MALLYDAASARPSLFATVSIIRATIRLAKITAAFKQSVKAEVCKPRGDPLTPRTRRAFKIRAYRSLDRASKPSQSRSAHREDTLGNNASIEWFNSLLKELDETSTSSIFDSPISKVAADGGLLLNHEIHSPTKTRDSTSWAKAAYEYDLVSLLLLALDRRIEILGSERNIGDIDSIGNKILTNEVCCANLHHFLLCLQRRLFDVLLRKSLIELEENALQWHKYWQQQKKLGLWWFLEWPSGRRPLSTTWPWNIKPSLLVLWGVCWMFYDRESISAQALFDNEAFWDYMPQTRDEDDGLGFSNIPMVQRRRGLFMDGANIGTSSDTAAPQWPSSSTSPSVYELGDSVLQGLLPLEYSDTSQAQSPIQGTSFAPQYSAGLSFDVDAFQGTDFTHPPAESPAFPSLVTFQAPGATPSVIWSPIYDSEPPQNVQRVSDFPNSAEDSTNIDRMHSNHEFSEPVRDPVPGPSISTRNSVTPVTPTDHPYPEDAISPTSNRSNEQKESERGGSEPPRNSHNQIFCKHVDCASKPPIFLRKCEWRKHVDKHTRPYRCEWTGCEKLQGFTYSGGLLRHEREVHKKDGGRKERMMCPYPDCKRSSGAGFTRKENLNEHQRRVHRKSGEIKLEDLNGGRSDDDDAAVTEMPRKRKRSLVSEWSASVGEGGGDAEDLHAKVMRMEEESFRSSKRMRGLDDRLLAAEQRLLETDRMARSSEDTIAKLTREIGELRRLFGGG